MASCAGNYTDSDEEDGRNSPTSSPCELTYNNLFEQFNCLSAIKEKELAEAQEISKSTRTRIVSRQWPRDPQGKLIAPDDGLEGKQAPNGQPLWGETILDFYHVQNQPDSSLGNSSTIISTGSRLAKWMKEHGELQWAVDELERAETENSPQETRPWHVSNAIEEQEQKIRSKACGWGQSMPKNAVQEGNTGIFKTSNYPAPWPLIPFSYPAEKLQHRVGNHGLPKKLIVHDPWGLLTGTHTDTNLSATWTDMPDITAAYQLELSKKDQALSSAVGGASQEPNLNVEGSSDHKGLQGFFLDPPTASSSPIAPPIYVVHPTPPTALPVPEAHLYLSPVHLAGKGTHSRVYHAELELPRDALTPFVMCKGCVKEDIAATLKEEDGDNGERMDKKWETKSTTVEIVEDVKRGNGILTAKSDTESTCLKQTDVCNNTYVFQSVPAAPCVQVTGAVRRIRTSVPWRHVSHPATCNHLQLITGDVQPETKSRPPTTKVRVAAKLSSGGDERLLQETKNYQEFSSHLFEHFTGFNLIPPVQDPVPIGAVVPHFYGYYVPERHGNEGSEGAAGRSQVFRSPILLLEDCGTPVNADGLNVDDKQECASLYHRFHYDGWTHGSVSARKILVQPGPMNASPRDRKPGHLIPTLEKYEMNSRRYPRAPNDMRTNPSFRLTGFKRSHQGMEGRNDEKADIEKVFGVHQ